MISAAKQYYQLGISQEEIARKAYVSKSTVSRLIRKAVDLGYVEFKINYSGEAVIHLQQELFDFFGIPCTVLPSFVDDYLPRLDDVCAYAARDIPAYIEDGETVGVTWGRTTEYLAKNLIPPSQEKRDVKICMLSGFVTGTIASMKATHIIEKFADIFSAQGFVMPAPLLVDTEHIAQVLLSDSNIRYVMNLCRKAQTVILSVGGTDLKDTFLTDEGTYNLSVYNKIAHSGGVGDVAGRNFDINGNEIQSNITGRIMSIPLADLKKKKNRICIAIGEHKSHAILGALRGGIVNRLYTCLLYTSFRLYINGRLAAECGSTQPYAPFVRDTAVSFSLAKENEIVLQTVNATHYYSGLTYPPVLGTAQAVGQLRAARLAFYGLLCFGTLAAAVLSLIHI